MSDIKSRTYEFTRILATYDFNSFMGICKILKIPISNGAKTKEEFDLRPFEDLWSDTVEKFNSLPDKSRNNLIKIMRQTVKRNGK